MFHHKLRNTKLRRNMKFSGPKQKRVRVRKNYSKEALLEELDNCSWTLDSVNDNTTMTEKIQILEKTVDMVNYNLNKALDKVAPFKIVNQRKEQEPWKNEDEVKKQFLNEKEAWETYKINRNNTKKNYGKITNRKQRER